MQVFTRITRRHGVVDWQLLPIALRSPMGKSLTMVGRSPLVTAEKTGGIVLAAPNGRICAVDLLQEHSGCNR